MQNIVIFLIILLCGSNAIVIEESPSTRISNAEEANINNFPYLVSIQEVALIGTPTRGHKCGGALITLQHVLTAATCTYDFFPNGTYSPINLTGYRIFGGATLLTSDSDQNRIRTIANITVHPQFIPPPSSFNNIAIITLNLPYANTTVIPIALPLPDFDPADFTLCQIASWGAQSGNETASTTLRVTTKYVYNHNLCTTLYSQMPTHVNIFSSMICAASFDILSSGCTGDLGIPLACSGGLAGIMFQTNECAVSSFPEVYTRVSNYTEWIRSISGSSTFKAKLTLFGVLAIVITKLVSKA